MPNNICDLRRIHNSIIKLLYVLLIPLLFTQKLLLQISSTQSSCYVLNSVPRAVTKTPKFHITSNLTSLHLLLIIFIEQDNV